MRGRALGVLSASALAVGGMAALAGPAAAAETIQCGQVIDHSLVAANNIGPCPGDGLQITAGGIILDLGGHTVKGSNTTNKTANQQVGVHFLEANGSTVKNGEVSNFDAGVAIEAGGRNTVKAINAHDNIAHVLLTGGVNPKVPVATPCDYGDGIVVDNSAGNHLIANKVAHNGPFSGIALVDNSDSNEVRGNQALDQTVSNMLPAGITNPPNDDGSPGDSNGPCGPFSATPTGEGRLHQDIGIRVEGPGADRNTVVGNQSVGNQLNGISIHGYVCLNGAGPTPPPGSPPRGLPNTGNLIKGNSVVGNGFADGIDGIGILRQGPFGTVVCASNDNSIIGNSSTGNARDGIFVPPTGDNSKPSHNTIKYNRTDNNGRDGVHVDGSFTVCPFGAPRNPNGSCAVPLEARNGSNNNTLVSNNGHGNVRRDGVDLNAACDANNWLANIFGTVNQACVTAGAGTGTVVPLP